MRVAIISLIIVIILSGIVFAGSTDPYDYQIEKIYEQPHLSSKEIYRIPVEIRLLDVYKDANWYKIKIKFVLGLINFEYRGWTYIPIGKILVEKGIMGEIK